MVSRVQHHCPLAGRDVAPPAAAERPLVTAARAHLEARGTHTELHEFKGKRNRDKMENFGVPDGLGKFK